MNYPPPTPNPDQARGVTVEEIVSGTRCSPLTLKEFEGFLIHEERSVENLQFIVWYRSYCERFKALPPQYQALSEPPMERFTAFSTPAGSIRTASSIKEREEGWWQKLVRRRSSSTLASFPRDQEVPIDYEGAKAARMEKAARDRKEAGEDEPEGDAISFRSAVDPNTNGSPVGTDVDVFPTKSRPHSLSAEDVATIVTPPSPAPPADVLKRQTTMDRQSLYSDNTSINTENSERRAKRFPNLRFANLTPLVSIVSRGSLNELPEDTPLPFIDEISLILTTFILPGSSKELNIDARLRKHILKSLQPVDEKGEKGPPVTTHPDVFKEAADHAYTLMERSLPHYLQWAKGNVNTMKKLFWIGVGFTDFMIGVMIALLLIFYVHKRGWRIFSAIFIDFGVMQAYSGYFYFCSQVHGRTARQLYPWELTTDIEKGEAAINPTATFGNVKNQDKFQADLLASMPFLFEEEDKSPATTLNDEKKPASTKTPAVFRSKFFASMRKKDGERVPMFGPERVVEDPYIKDLHNKQIREVLIVGAVVTICLEAAIMAIPQQIPR